MSVDKLLTENFYTALAAWPFEVRHLKGLNTLPVFFFNFVQLQAWLGNNKNF